MRSRFVVDIPGQPPSWNRSYRIIHKNARDRYGQAVIGSDGRPKTYSSLMKDKSVVEYQELASYIIKAARPSDFNPEGLVYVCYRFRLGRDIDCDNVMKALNDTLAESIGINDKRFLPVAISKETGSKEPQVSLSVFDAKYWAVEVGLR